MPTFDIVFLTENRDECFLFWRVGQDLLSNFPFFLEIAWIGVADWHEPCRGGHERSFQIDRGHLVHMSALVIEFSVDDSERKLPLEMLP